MIIYALCRRLVAWLFLLPLTAMAGPLTADAARERLLSYIEQTETYAAEFSQQLTDADGYTEDGGTGRFWLARPGQFKWLYEQPVRREIVADGDRIWLYDADLDQVTVRDLAGILATTPAGLLAGDTRNLADYEFSGAEAGTRSTIVLTPRSPGSDFDRITMVLDGVALASLTLDDRFGQQTVIEFSAARSNVPVAADIFTFSVPANADVIDETGGE
ncbi:MAG: outer membrane lipoprotein chaperone LolA [Gammaproteobacteria bacterium]|jgi:outer membrane lipoprotein carrier protein|nr:outer membrane lipoprotein chaperone LolA [Gammaproteobacteria bacterium]